jgi:hypothetical protein
MVTVLPASMARMPPMLIATRAIVASGRQHRDAASLTVTTSSSAKVHPSD